ncbi:hypothetical protein FM125_04945 [Micrococcus lylae]|uniref:Uncharacterized protein n=1 Tax=Micrococcus lylae TaxID=1273 RepID=A0A1R4IWI5_9MICC|nr:hypothetical protein [Micrococcus lylae]SJN24068.1 hypothetical protein FM125_04945 [Micrococcus lylae]
MTVRPWRRVWLHARGVSAAGLGVLALGPFACALTTAVALPADVGAPADQASIAGHADTVVVSVALASVFAGLLMLILVDRTAWMTRTGARVAWLDRAVWLGAVCGVWFALHLAASLLLPPQPGQFTLFLTYPALWLGIGLCAVTWGGPIAGSLAPVLVCMVMSLNAVPWPYNVVFNPHVADVRMAITVVLLILGACVYCRSGHREPVTS